MFLVGTIIFTLFIVSLIWEKKIEAEKELEIDSKNYYERYGIQVKKKPKTKKGSQSRRKHYKIEEIIK